MSAIAWLAYGSARVRARKSRLLTSSVLSALVAAERPDLTVDGWRDVQSEADAALLLALVYARLMTDYEALIRAYPSVARVLRALAQRHELENVKLAWRAAACSAEPARWHPLWRPMGRLETVSRSNASVSSLQQLAHALSRTPFDNIASHVLRAHGADLSAAEMALDRWGSDMLMHAAADALAPRDGAALDLVAHVVCERDVAVLERAVGSLGVAPQSAIRMTSMLSAALGSAGIRHLAEWSRDGGAPVQLPRRLSSERRAVRTFVELRQAIRASRRAACARVFVSNHFSLAPPIALVLMREDEARALMSIGELRARHATTADAARRLDFDG